MNENAHAKDRSPRAPAISLEEAVAIVRKLYLQTRTAAVKPDSAAKAMGYSGLSGSSATALATLGQYGLVDRVGGNVVVSSLAVRILHPRDEAQKEAAIKEAALLPKIFLDTLGGFEECAPEAITNHLVQSGFIPDRARRVAEVYTENRRFARLDHPSKPAESEVAKFGSAAPPPSNANSAPVSQAGSTYASDGALVGADIRHQQILAQHSIPLGPNKAVLTITGESLASEDFDALIDFVEFAKKQFVRGMRARGASLVEN